MEMDNENEKFEKRLNLIIYALSNHPEINSGMLMDAINEAKKSREANIVRFVERILIKYSHSLLIPYPNGTVDYELDYYQAYPHEKEVINAVNHDIMRWTGGQDNFSFEKYDITTLINDESCCFALQHEIEDRFGPCLK